MKKIILVAVFFITTITFRAQTTLAKDSLAGFDEKELLHHLGNFKGTEKEKQLYISRVKKEYIRRKYFSGMLAKPPILAKNGNQFNPQTSCTNIDFEQGNTSGWAVTGASLITSGAGLDPFGNFPVVYPGGNYSLKLSDNNLSTTSFTSTATRVISVTPANSFLNLHYALDILDFPHDSLASAKLSIQFFDGAGNLLTCPQVLCTYFTDALGNPHTVGASSFQQTWGNATGFPTTGPGVNLGGQNYPVNYLDWQTIGLDLSPYMGTNLTCVITCDWCLYQYDWAYCYIDADCSNSGSASNQITQSNPLCAGGSTSLQGPPGMATYNWTGPISGTTQNLITNTPGNYTLTITSAGNCSFVTPTLYYTLIQNASPSPTVTIITSQDSICSGTSTTLTATGADIYTWSTTETADTISVSPINNTTYLVIGTDTASGCAGSDTQAVHINGLITIDAVNNPICTGTTATLTASGATTYTWSSNAGSVTTSTVVVSPTSGTHYTVTGTDNIHGCTSSITEFVDIGVNLALQNPQDTICDGTTVTLTASGTTSYTWSTGATTTNITVTPSVTATYTVTGSGGVCSNTATTSITVFSLPSLTVTASPFCEGGIATLTASGANTYTWNTGTAASSITVTPTANTEYTVRGTSIDNCVSVDTITVIVPVNQSPLICMITTDSASNYNYNIIYWDKTSYSNVDSFIVYRKDAISSTYLRIGAVSKDSLSEFMDTAFSIGGPNGGNPLYSSWTYKLAIRDTCGNVSAQSPYHQTMFVQESGANFSWNAYTIESTQTNPVTGYSFLRDNNNTGSWQVLVNTTALSTTDPNYSTYPNGNWRVDAIGFSCTPSLSLGHNNQIENTFQKAHSNLNKPTTIGIKQFSNNLAVAISPNPNNGNFTLEFNNYKNTSVEIYSILGDLVYKTNLQKEKTNINLQNINKGTYMVHIISDNGTAVKRVVIE
jgi:hypothetical protein